VTAKRIVHIVGTGTIGEPLIGLFTDFREKLGIDEVTFHKRTPMVTERAKVNHLMERGAKLVTDHDRVADFEKMGHKVSHEADEAIRRATVIIDCTPAGNDNKERIYKNFPEPKGFLAQGSEFGFGKMYARGINDEALKTGEDRFIQIVSCNTHNISALIKTIAVTSGKLELENGHFVCMRRSNDISQDKDFIPAPSVGKHDDADFGTHHAHDVYHLYETLGMKPRIFSSAIKLNTQYMHTLWFSMVLGRDTTREEVLARIKANDRLAITERKSANAVFSFGRDHGYYGRILSQTVLPTQTIAVREKREVVGFCYTPQDGNSLLSSIAATLWLIDPNKFEDRLQAVKRFVFTEV